MEKKKPDFKTWWWYHKVHILIAAVAVAIVLYSVLPVLLTPQSVSSQI